MVYGFDEKKCKVEVMPKENTYVIEVNDITVTQSPTRISLSRPTQGKWCAKSIMYSDTDSYGDSLWKHANTFDSKILANVELRDVGTYVITRTNDSGTGSLDTSLKIILERYQ